MSNRVYLFAFVMAMLLGSINCQENSTKAPQPRQMGEMRFTEVGSFPFYEQQFYGGGKGSLIITVKILLDTESGIKYIYIPARGYHGSTLCRLWRKQEVGQCAH